MDIQTIHDDLVELLSKNGIAVREEKMAGSGSGLCKIREKYIFFVDTEAGIMERASSAAKALADTVDLESIYLRPAVRDFIESNQA